MKLIFFSTYNNNLITPIMMLNKDIYLVINIVMFTLLLVSLINYRYLTKRACLLVVLLVILESIFNISFLVVENPYLIFLSKAFTFLSSIYINEEIYINKKSAKLLTPFILWEFYLTLISVIILFLNT